MTKPIWTAASPRSLSHNTKNGRKTAVETPPSAKRIRAFRIVRAGAVTSSRRDGEETSHGAIPRPLARDERARGGGQLSTLLGGDREDPLHRAEQSLGRSGSRLEGEETGPANRGLQRLGDLREARVARDERKRAG